MHVRSYLEIQQIRYQDILNYEIAVPEELFDYQIPKITIQPIVENALYHGIKNKRGGGTIVVSGKDEGETMLIQVKDDGKGMKPERLKEINKDLTGAKLENTAIYGLYNVNERIRLSFGEEYGITVESTYEVGSCISIRLPKILNIIVEK